MQTSPLKVVWALPLKAQGMVAQDFSLAKWVNRWVRKPLNKRRNVPLWVNKRLMGMVRKGNNPVK
jgi:hypothetical protein